MRPSQLIKVLAKAIEHKRPVLIKGAPGIGKTDIVNQAAKLAGANVLPVFASMCEPTDGKGLPGIVNGVAEFLPFGYLRQMIETDELLVVFLDDLGQATPATQAAFMQLILARVDGNGTPISEKVVFIAATNRREDKAGVSGLLEPVKSRFATIVELETDVDGWIEWAIKNDLPLEIIAFIKYRPNMLHNFKPSADLVNSPCPRTVANVARLLEMELPPETLHEVITGAAGEAFAAEFLAFLPMYRELPPIDAIIMSPDSVHVSGNIGVNFAVCSALARKANENNLDRILKYIDRLPSDEFRMMFIKQAIENNVALAQTGTYIRWASANAQLAA